MAPLPSAEDFAAALPDRPITVRPPATAGPASMAGVFAMLLGLLGGALWWLGPDLARDWSLGRDLVEARDVRLGEARCVSRVMIVAVCEVPYHTHSGAGADTATLWYLFIGSAAGGPIRLLEAGQQSERTPAAVTTDLGLAKLYHRTITLLLVVAFLAFCIWLSIDTLRAGMATRRELVRLSGQRLAPVIVGLEGSIPIAHRRKRWTYLWDDGGATRRAHVELPSRVDPLFVTPDGKRAMALQAPEGGVPLLLDAQLGSLDLTEAEKAAFFDACRAALARRNPH
ncbi:MAG TPA: hypothetical protein VFA64_12000 [Hyphomicrobiaceae bacterium]|nr:hypothetical protein [Hyphomicrobiaceae bacterium]